MHLGTVPLGRLYFLDRFIDKHPLTTFFPTLTFANSERPYQTVEINAEIQKIKLKMSIYMVSLFILPRV